LCCEIGSVDVGLAIVRSWVRLPVRSPLSSGHYLDGWLSEHK